MSDLSEHGFLCHSPPLSFTVPPAREQQHYEVLFAFMMVLYGRAAVSGTGNPPSSLEHH